MNLFAISYDLRIPGQSYTTLFAALERLQAVKVEYSVWVCRSSSTAVQICNFLKQFIDSNDRLLVVQVADWASVNAMANINTVAA